MTSKSRIAGSLLTGVGEGILEAARARRARTLQMLQNEAATNRDIAQDQRAEFRALSAHRRRQAEHDRQQLANDERKRREDALKPPKTREVNRGDDIVTEEWDATTRSFREISRSPRYSDRESYADVLVPLARKLRDGGELTPGEQRAADLLQRTDAFDRLMRDITSPQPAPDDSTAAIIRDAHEAIGRGAEREAVRQRLRDLGVDPALAGI